MSMSPSRVEVTTNLPFGDILQSLSEATATEGAAFSILSELSPRDSKWKDRKQESLAMSNLYRGTLLERYAERMDLCSQHLQFELVGDESGERHYKLRLADFCRVRHCPICQWRRSMMWAARCHEAFPRILRDYPKSRFIFMTLTVRNCDVVELRSTLEQMNKAWHRMIGRKVFPATGWMRNVEVTRGKDGTAHPHFHALLMVDPGYFGGQNYLSQPKWIELWKSCLKVDYQPSMRINTVKGNIGSNASTNHAHSDKPAPLPIDLLKAIRYTIKYSTKPEDILGVKSGNHAHSGSDSKTSNPLADSTADLYADSASGLADLTADSCADSAWLVELTCQLHKTRAIALGGIFKKYMKEDEPEDLINSEDSEDSGQPGQNPEATYFWSGSNYVLPFGTATD